MVYVHALVSVKRARRTGASVVKIDFGVVRLSGGGAGGSGCQCELSLGEEQVAVAEEHTVEKVD